MIFFSQRRQGQDLLKAQPTVPGENSQPIQAFVELERYNAIKFVQSVNSDIIELGKVLKGQALLTTKTQAIAHDLIHHQTPSAWVRLWDGEKYKCFCSLQLDMSVYL